VFPIAGRSSATALVVGAKVIRGSCPANLAIEQAALFWGIIASMWAGNLMLVVLNLPLLGFVPGSLPEENLRRAMILLRGSLHLRDAPDQCDLPGACACGSCHRLFAVGQKRKREEVFQEGE